LLIGIGCDGQTGVDAFDVSTASQFYSVQNTCSDKAVHTRRIIGTDSRNAVARYNAHYDLYDNWLVGAAGVKRVVLLHPTEAIDALQLQ
jgi:hypothetical protein